MTEAKEAVTGVQCEVPGARLIEILSASKDEAMRRTVEFIAADRTYLVAVEKLRQWIWESSDESQEPSPRDRALIEMVQQVLLVMQQAEARAPGQGGETEWADNVRPAEPPPAQRARRAY